MNQNQFILELKKINIEVNEQQLEKLEKYYQILIKNNEKTNLTRIIDKKAVYLKHFYDSLTIKRVFPIEKVDNLCDVGSGAGFPGIVLKIIFPEIRITLLEATRKKAEFLEKTIETLELEEITVVNKRVESWEIIEKFDLVVARAVAPTPVLTELTAKIITVGGYLIFYKGDISREINRLGNNFKKLNLELVKCEEFNLPVEKAKRSLLLLKKTKKTPKNAPRSYNLIKKHPFL